MPDIVKFKSGNKSSLVDASDNNILPIEAGTVYFTVDNNGKGAIYFDKDSTHRILMTTALDTSLADIANKDGIGNVIHETYLANIAFDGTTNTTKVSAILTKGDSSTDLVDLPTAGPSAAGIINTGAQTIAGNKTFTGAFSSSGGATFSNSSFNYSGIEAGTANAARTVWFSDNTTIGKPVYDNDFTYNPSTNTLVVTNLTGLASNATADDLGQTISDTYLKNITINGSTITLVAGDDGTSTVTAPYLLLTGGIVTGDTTFSSTVSINTATISTANITTANITNMTVSGTATFTGLLRGNLTGTAQYATNDAAGNNIEDTYYPKAGGIITGGVEIKGHIAGDNSATGHGLWSGGAYHRNYNNLLLHGDATTGTSGIAFVSDRGTNNIGQPSDRAFIQYHARAVTTITDENNHPTITTGGDDAVLVIGIGNDEEDQIWVQTQGSTGLKHLIGTTLTTIPSLSATTSTAYYPVVSTTTPGVNTYNTSVTIEGGVITANSFSGALAGQADTALWAAVAEADEAGNQLVDYLFGWEVSNNGNLITITQGDGDSTTLNTPWLPLSGGTVTGNTTFTGNVTMSGASTSITNLTIANLISTLSATFTNGLTGNVTGNLYGDGTTSGIADYAKRAYGDSGLITDTYIAEITSTPANHIITYEKGSGGTTSLSLPYVLLAGDTMTGTLNFDPNIVAIDWNTDKNNTSLNKKFHATASYQTNGNEALVFATGEEATSFIFVNGEDSTTNHGATRWTSLTGDSGGGNAPGLQIKNNCVSIGELIPNNATPFYKFLVNGHTHVKGKLIVDPSYGADTLSNSYNEGIRINQAANGWAEIMLGGAVDSNASTSDGAWIVGRRGATGNYGGAVGDFTIEEQGSDGKGLTIHKDNGGISLYTVKASGASAVNIHNDRSLSSGNRWYAINATDTVNGSANNTETLIAIGRDASNKNQAIFGYHHNGMNNSNVGLDTNYATIGFLGAEHLLNILASGQVGIGTVSPIAKLQVMGDTVISGNLSVGKGYTSVSGQNTPNNHNYITFYGNSGERDNTHPEWSNNDYIGNRKWGGDNASELFIFKGNDPGNAVSGTAISASTAGPDRIRLAAAAHVFQTYNEELNLDPNGDADAFENIAKSNKLYTKLEIAHNLMTSYVPFRMHAVNSWTTITLCDSSNTGATGSTSDTWAISNHSGEFLILKGGATSASSGSTYFSCLNNGIEDYWTWNGIAEATVRRAWGDESGDRISTSYVKMEMPLDVEIDPNDIWAIDGADMDLYNAAINYASDALDQTHHTLHLKDALYAGLIRPSIWGGQAITDSSTLALNKVDKEDPYIFLWWDENDPDYGNLYNATDKSIYDSLVALGWDQDCIVPNTGLPTPSTNPNI